MKFDPERDKSFLVKKGHLMEIIKIVLSFEIEMGSKQMGSKQIEAAK